MQLRARNTGRSAVLLASILSVGIANSANATPEDPALAMQVSAMQSPQAIANASHQSATDPVPTPALEVVGIGEPIDAIYLDDFRGGNAVSNDVTIDGNVTGNTADRIISGSNTIQDGAFANASGISTVIQNSGSNVLIQNGMVVNVQFVDPGM